MAIEVQIVDETTPGSEESRTGLPVSSAQLTLRDLIRERVRHEVAAYNQHQPGIFQGLVQPEDERLLPNLPVRDRCRLGGRFLVVTGQRATYKIHLGGGNVLTEPGSRYPCILQGPSPAKTPSRVLLPFEGDGTLALILSKAFLLADDSKIKDASILRQLPS